MRATTLSDLVRRLQPWRGRVSIRYARDVLVEVRTRNFVRREIILIDEITFGRNDVVLVRAAKMVREISQLELERERARRLSRTRERPANPDRSGS